MTSRAVRTASAAATRVGRRNCGRPVRTLRSIARGAPPPLAGRRRSPARRSLAGFSLVRTWQAPPGVSRTPRIMGSEIAARRTFRPQFRNPGRPPSTGRDGRCRRAAPRAQRSYRPATAVGARRCTRGRKSSRSDSSRRLRSARSVPVGLALSVHAVNGRRSNEPVVAAGAEVYERRLDFPARDPAVAGRYDHCAIVATGNIT